MDARVPGYRQRPNRGLRGIRVAAFAPRGLDRDWALTGIGLTMAPHDNLSLFISYDLQLGARQTFHVANGGVQLVW